MILAKSLNYTQVWVALATANLDCATQFYRQLFGKSPVIEQVGVYAEFHLPGLRLGIFTPRSDHASQFAPVATAPFSLCLEVPDLEAAIAQLHHLGYPPPGAILTAGHGREIYAYDPDGNRLILHQGFSP